MCLLSAGFSCIIKVRILLKFDSTEIVTSMENVMKPSKSFKVSAAYKSNTEMIHLYISAMATRVLKMCT